MWHDLALINLALDSRLRACDLVKLSQEEPAQAPGCGMRRTCGFIDPAGDLSLAIGVARLWDCYVFAMKHTANLYRFATAPSAHDSPEIRQGGPHSRGLGE